MKKLKNFENFREEFPHMFEPKKPEDEPQEVPGFEDGTIDPEDDEIYLDDYGKPLLSSMSEKDRYEDFKKITTERNIKEDEYTIEINLNKLYHDFIMSIFNPNKHYKEFVNKYLLGNYISKGAYDIMSENSDNIEGIVEKVGYYFSDNSPILSLKLKDVNVQMDNLFTHSVIIIDKAKSNSHKYNL